MSMRLPTYVSGLIYSQGHDVMLVSFRLSLYHFVFRPIFVLAMFHITNVFSSVHTILQPLPAESV